MGLIKIDDEIYGSNNSIDIIFNDTTVYNQLNKMIIGDIEDNENISQEQNNYLTYAHICDNLESTANNKVLSANQGNQIKELINSCSDDMQLLNDNVNNQLNIISTNINTVSNRVESTRDEIENFIYNDLINIIYPIGSIYMSVNNVSPASFLGGTWEQIKDRFLLAAGSSYSAGSTGGEVAHKLIQNEIPNYNLGFLPQAVMGNHGEWANEGIIASSQDRGTRNTVTATSGTSNPQWGYIINTNGGDAAHNNMPPYLTVYMWKRIG